MIRKIKTILKQLLFRLYDKQPYHLNYKAKYEYLINHVDITTLKPATGWLRKYQLGLLDFAQSFFEETAELHIKPFIFGGMVIGAVRHKGFIPWDDDLDFALIREEYDKLVDFCKKRYKTIIYETTISKYQKNPYSGAIKWKTALAANPNQYIFFIHPEHIQIGKGTSLENFYCIDFFSFDFFEDAYSFAEHKKYLSQIEKKIKEIDYIPKVINFLDNEKQHDGHTKDGPNLYFGIDNINAYLCKSTQWMPKDFIFPLKKVRFENTEFWAPGKIIDYAKYTIPSFWNFPDDIGYLYHLDTRNRFLRSKKYAQFALKRKDPQKITVEFYLIDAFEIFHFEPIYRKLLEMGHNAVFVAEPCKYNTSKNWFDYNEAVKILEEHGLEYKETCNPWCDIAVTTQTAKILSKYKAKKVNLGYGFSFLKDIFALSKQTTAGFDARMVHGAYYKNLVPKKYMNKDNIYIIGYPKYDDYWKKRPSKHDLLSNLNINPAKPILLYLPTWGKNSSITYYASEVAKLKECFFVITKAHHCTYRLPECKNELDTLYAISDIVLPGNSPFTDAVTLADIYLADARSGAMCESLYLTPKPCVLISLVKNIDAFYYQDISKMGTVISEPHKLYNAINDEYKISRNNNDLITGIYGKNDGNSSSKAAFALLKIAGQKN